MALLHKGSYISGVSGDTKPTSSISTGVLFVETNTDKIYHFNGSGWDQIIPTSVPNASLSNSSITIGDSSIALGATDTTLTGLTDIDLTSGSKTIFDGVGSNTLTIGAGGTTVALAGNVTIGGTLTVNGTTTTNNSTTVTIDDPIFSIGGDTAPSSADTKDRGIEFRYFRSGDQARIGWFGWDNSASANTLGVFTGFTAATNSSEVMSGTRMSGHFNALTTDGNVAIAGNAVFTASAAASGISFTIEASDGSDRLAISPNTSTGANYEFFALNGDTITLTSNFTQAYQARFVHPTYSGNYTITQAATVYISAPATVASSAVITNNYALWVDAGVSRFDGNVGIGSLFSTSGVVPDGELHIANGTAGSVNADGAARLIIEDNAQAVLQFLVPAANNAGIYVGSPAGAYRGAIFYNNTGAAPGDTWRFVTAGTQRLLYSAGAFAFQEATTISTSTGNLTFAAAAGADVLIGDDVTLLYVDGGNGHIGLGAAAEVSTGVNINSGAFTATANTNAHRVNMAHSSTITVPTGTTDIVTNLNIEEPLITATGTVTNSASLRIGNAATEATNNWAIWVDAGKVKFDDDLTVGNNVTVSNGLLTNYIRANDGSAGAPGYEFQSDTDTGIYRPGTNQIGFSTGGAGSVVLSGGATPTFAFQGATTISTSTNDLTLDPAASLNVTLTDDDADALTFANSGSNYYNISTLNNATGTRTHTFDAEDSVVASGTAVTHGLMDLSKVLYTFTGTASMTSLQSYVTITGPKLDTDTGGLPITKATTLSITAPEEGTSGGGVTLAASSALRILNASGTPTTQYGVYIENLTAGATDDVAIYTENGSMFNLTTGGPTAPDNDAAIHIWAGDTSQDATTGSYLILEAATNNFLEFMVDASTRAWGIIGKDGDDVDANNGIIWNVDASDALSFRINSTISRLKYSAGAFAFTEPTVISTVGLLSFEPTTDVTFTNSSTTNVNFFTVRASDGAGGLNISPITQLASGNATYIIQDFDEITLTGANATTYALVDVFRVQSNRYTATNAGQTITDARTMYLEPVIKGNNGGNTPTITTASTLYISSGGTAGATNYALWSDSGDNRFDGRVYLYDRGGEYIESDGGTLQLRGEAVHIEASGGNLTVKVDASGGLFFQSPEAIYSRASHLFYWQDRDDSNANRMTLNSSDGELKLYGAAMEFQQASTISTTAGNLTLDVAGAGVVISDHLSVGPAQTPSDSVLVRLGNITSDAAVVYGILSSTVFTLDQARSAIMGHEQAHSILTNNHNLGNYYGIRYTTVGKSGSGTITRLDSIFLSPQTIATNNSAITIETGWTAPAAYTNAVQMWVEDITGGDARLGIQSEAGEKILIGNNALKFGDVAAEISTTSGLITLDSPSGETFRYNGSQRVQVRSGDIRFLPDGSNSNTLSANGFSFQGPYSLSTASGALTLDPATDVLIANGKGMVIGHTAQLTVGGQIDLGSGNVGTATIPELQVLGIFEDASILIGMFASTDERGPNLTFLKSDNSSIGGFDPVVDDENLGYIVWEADDNTDYQSTAAYLKVRVDGSVATGQVPGRMEFATTPVGASAPIERMRIDSAGVVTIGGAIVKTVGTENMWVPAMSMTPRDNAGCAAIATVAAGTSGRPDFHVLDFDNSSDEHAQFMIAMPKSWDGGNIYYTVYWIGLAATTGVAWGLEVLSLNDNEEFNQAYANPIIVTDDSQGDVTELLISAKSGAIACSGADNDLLCLQFYRDVSDGNDDMAGDARLVGLLIEYTTNAATDG